MHVPTRDHLWANREVRLENHQQQEKYWLGEFLVQRPDLAFEQEFRPTSISHDVDGSEV